MTSSRKNVTKIVPKIRYKKEDKQLIYVNNSTKINDFVPLKNIIKPRYDIYKSREHITKQLAVSSADFVAVVFVFLGGILWEN